MEAAYNVSFEQLGASMLFRLLALLCVCSSVFGYEKITLESKFYSEGAGIADMNNDGIPDVVSGPFLYLGPDFRKKIEIYESESFDPEKYSENFGVHLYDFNGDGWKDYLIFPHPGKDSFWLENPKGAQGHWKKHLAFKNLGNESPISYDVTGDGVPDVVYNINGFIGYGTFDAKRDNPFEFHPVSPESAKYQRYTHGIGAGDIDGDGLCDIIQAEGFWKKNEWHPFKFAEAAAHIHVYDIDGDGLNDVVCAWHCHEYGLNFWKQKRGENGEIQWEKKPIFLSEPDFNSDALRISQMHALVVADMNNDGLPDLVTGKRYWAHGSTGDKEPDAAAVLAWLELKRDGKGNASFVPHVIDSSSGVGTQFAVGDLNKDGVPDIAVGSKKGVFVFLSEK